MSNPIRPFRLAAAVASLVLAACGGTDNQPDEYAGTLYAGTSAAPVLDAKFMPVSGSYLAQQGSANGRGVSFRNLGALQTEKLPNPIRVTVATHQTNGSGGASADSFPNSCTPGPAFDRRTDAYTKDKQGPIFDSLPLALTSTSLIVWPLVAQYGVTGVSGMTCNDLKDSRSIAAATDPEPGRYGARRTAIPNSYQLWPVIDLTATVSALPGVANDTTTRECPWDTNADPAKRARCGHLGWYKGLQVAWLNGGRIPTQMVQDPAFPTDPTRQVEAFVPMDGVILNPVGTGFSLPTENDVVLLPALPGEDAWSPIVRLHNFRLPSGRTFKSYSGICGNGKPCAANLVDINAAAPAAFYTIFIAAPQQ